MIPLKWKYKVKKCLIDLIYNSGEGRTSFVSLRIRVLDENDNTPMFEFNAPNLNQLKVRENKPVGTNVFKASAHDRDAGANGIVRYTFLFKDLLVHILDFIRV